METHYNAFISYRHHPQDIRVASGIQKALERYRIPKALRGKAKKGIHIFRDKEELPITSNLTDELTRALENSEFLIVICSTHTKESVWVQKEIETFLKTHSKNHVLTVLVDGEPYEVIPEVLQYDEVVDPVTGLVQRLPIDPLSCDWRSSSRRIQKAELARLAAALLGCGYDELRQRQRQYRMRQVIAGFSGALVVSLAFTAYFIHTSLKIQRANDALQEANIQIRSNYEEALRNQSQYLTKASAQRLEAGDRLSAIALAVEALPDETGDRPYYPEAERALNLALGTYDTSSQIMAEGSFDPGALVQKFVVTDDGAVIFIQDARGVITAWDTRKFERLSSLDFGKVQFLSLWATAEGHLLLHTNEKKLYCCTSDGSILWQIEKCNDFAFLDDKKTVLVMEHEVYSGTTLRFLDPVTGLERRSALRLAEEEERNYSFAEDAYPEENVVTLESSAYDEYLNVTYTIFLADLDTGVVKLLMEVPERIHCTTSAADGKILVMASDGSGFYNGIYLGMQTTSASRDWIYCYDRQTGSQLWKTEIISYVYSGHYHLQEIPGTDRILCQKDNVFQILDLATGQVQGACAAPAGVLSLTVDAGEAMSILGDGSLCRYSYEDDTCYSFQYMEDELVAGQINNGIFTIRNMGTQVTVYRTLEGGNWQRYAGEYRVYAYESMTQGNLLAVKGANVVYLFDMEKQTLLTAVDIKYADNILGFSRDGTKLWLWRKAEKAVLSYDLKNGEQTVMELPPVEANVDFTLMDSVWYEEDRLYYLAADQNATETAVCLDLNSMEQICVRLPEWGSSDTAGFARYAAYCLADSGYAWIFRSDGALFEIDWMERTVYCRGQDIESFPAVARDPDSGMAAAACDHELIMFLPGGDEIRRLPLDEKKAGSLCELPQFVRTAQKSP